MSLKSLTSAPVRRGQKPLAVLAAVTLLTGIGAGLGGMLLALLLHGIQHLAYGYSVTHVDQQREFSARGHRCRA